MIGGKFLKFESRKCHFLHSVFEINKGKNTQKVKKITIIYHYLLEEDSNGHVCGGVLPGQKISEIGSTEMPFPAF
jgi:hypothetical protein